MRLNDSVTEIKGIGRKTAEKLKRLEIATVGDLLHHYPRRYQDYSQITPIAKAGTGMVTIKGEITRVASRRSRKGTHITEALIEDDTGNVKAVWFNQPYLAQNLPKNQEVYLSGELAFKYNQMALQTPNVEAVSDFPKDAARIVPIYPETEGISSKQLRGFVKKALNKISLTEHLPAEIVGNLMPYPEAIRQIHFPENHDLKQSARKRLAFDELFRETLVGSYLRSQLEALQAPEIEINETLAQKFVGQLEFQLTDAQRKAAWRILQDIAEDTPMNRLLQGDVGSGKTVVAAMVALMAASAGWQAAFLAPTSVLAKQHHQTLQEVLGKFEVQVDLLVGAATESERDDILDNLKTNNSTIIIGTHALLNPEVEFNKLGLLIIDEQHRFGVEQRQQLKNQEKIVPHVLTMTATPIPRTQALLVYGDLDISTLDEMPKGRKPVETTVAEHSQRHEIYKHIDQHIEQGKQVYVVCPLVAKSDKITTKNVEDEAHHLQTQVFEHRTVGKLHGQMNDEAKQQAIQRFRDGELDLLVTTNVIEVGMDIPNASIILIEGAERFGIAQLHQLRGRVGRSHQKSYCYLIASRNQSTERLQLLSKYNDGFILAEKDLELRGPGEMFGTRQHGYINLQLADLSDLKQIKLARERAQEFLDNYQLKDYPKLDEYVQRAVED